jgi:hypothetical protein
MRAFRTLLLVSLLPTAAAALAAPAPKIAPTGGNAQVDAQLRVMFDKADANTDGFLDRDEIAKAFRGPRAKAPTGGIYDDKGNFTPLYYQAKQKYPELVFLWAADKDGDNQLSWDEFRQYGEAYAASIQHQQQAMQQAMQNAYRQAARSVRTSRPRRTTSYVRNTGRYVYAQQRTLAHQVQAQQQQRLRMGQAYQQAMHRQYELRAQQMNYLRARAVAYHRTPQRHATVVYHHSRRR